VQKQLGLWARVYGPETVLAVFGIALNEIAKEAQQGRYETVKLGNKDYPVDAVKSLCLGLYAAYRP